MKPFVFALFSVSAALALPAPSANSFKSQECTCITPTGKMASNGWCEYQAGQSTKDGYCHRAVSYAPEMPTVFSDYVCVYQYGEGSTFTCRETTLCENTYGGYDRC